MLPGTRKFSEFAKILIGLFLKFSSPDLHSLFAVSLPTNLLKYYDLFHRPSLKITRTLKNCISDTVGYKGGRECNPQSRD